MSAFNILNSKIKCSECDCTYMGKVQFKFGDTWQLQYKIGDKIKWGGNDIGKPSISKVKVYGILEIDECPICGKENLNNEFDIDIENDIIIAISPMREIKDYFGDEGNYKICIE